MEAVEKALTYHDDTGLHRKLLPSDINKDKCNSAIQSDESTYVDLDMKTDGTKTVKVTFTGEGNQLAVFKCNSDTSGEKSPRELDADNVDNIISKGLQEEHTKDKSTDRPVSSELPIDTLSLADIGNVKDDFELGSTTEIQNETDSQNMSSDCEELQYTDMYLNSKIESDDDASVVLSETDDGVPNTAEDESHYITTHEIQLTELDHDVDYDFGRGTCWDFEDDNLVYSFVDYASFESDRTAEGTLLLEGRNHTKVKGSQTKSNITHKPERGAIVSPELESDLCDCDKCGSSDESICKTQNCSGNSAGKIHLSIKTSSRAINESNNIQENDNVCYHTKHVGDSHVFFTSTDTRTEALCDRTNYFIPAPGRQHLATKLRGKDINEYSSGASSSISELDDADKEVRNLTAKSFRSLACPYFDAINLSTSSESSMSEYGLGLNQWSAYVDLKYGSMSKGREHNLISHKSSSATFQMGKTAECKNTFSKSVSHRRDPQTKMYALNKKIPYTQQGSSSSDNLELKGHLKSGKEEVITLTETLNFRCNVQAGLPEGARRANCFRNAHGSRSKDEITGAVPVKLACEVNHQHIDTGGSMEGTHKKAIFASSLLKNVISKKMQFEQERKMERGEIRDTFPAQSPCFQCRHQDITKEKGRGLQRQTSETSSGFTLNSLEEQWAMDSRPNSSEPTEERENQAQLCASNSLISSERALDTRRDEGEPTKGPINWSHNSAFKSWKEGEQEPKTEIGCDRIIEIPTLLDNTSTVKLEADSTPSKMSNLFVQSSQIVPKDINSEGNLLISTPASDPRGKFDKILEKEENEKGAKAPEIKIRLRSVKENKGYPLDIANLLTPKINTIKNLKPAGDSNCQVLAVSDKIPHFTVRDIRDNKCKFQTPIYQVRDVRKLVKSSYRLVSLDNSDNKCPPVHATEFQEAIKDKEEKDMHAPPSPIVIKCQSVKTNNNLKHSATEASSCLPKELEFDSSSAKISPENIQIETALPQRATSRVAPVFVKQLNPELSEHQLYIESKLKQRQEKLLDSGEWKPESKIPKQAALEKLKAAVKTMEQLYVFDRNEWKRKTQAPKPITDSHVLSLIASEEQVVEEQGAAVGCIRLMDSDNNAKRLSQNLANIATTETRKGSQKIIHVPYNEDAFKTQDQQGKIFSNKSVIHFGNCNKKPVNTSSPSNERPQAGSPSLSTMKSTGSKLPEAPLPLKISTPKCVIMDRGRLKGSPSDAAGTTGTVDSENYLTIPMAGYVSEVKVKEGNSANTCHPSISETKLPEHIGQSRQKSPVFINPHSPEPSATSIYHHSVPMATHVPKPQVFCFSPSIPTLQPTPLGADIFPHTQRKMLLDPTTGHYYLVDTAIQPTTKRLFDPETGQYMDVPMTHSPVSPVTPLPMSPVVLSPGAYAPTYMIYPGFLTSSPLPPQQMQPQTAYYTWPEEDSVGKHLHFGQEENTASADSPYYSATGGSTPAPQRQPVTLEHITTRGSSSMADGNPVIGITSQQGPRIIAPPSFDGTTMSFVVEHR